MKKFREILAESGVPGPKSTHQEHHDFHEKMAKRYEKHKNVGSANEEAARIRQAAQHRKAMEWHARKIAEGKGGEKVIVESKKSPVPGMSYAEWRKHEGDAPGTGKPKSLKVGARVDVSRAHGGHGKGEVHALYDKALSTGKTKQFMHVKYDNGKEEHHRVDTTNHKVI